MVSCVSGGNGGLLSFRDSASPYSEVSGVRMSCDSAERMVLRKRSESICIRASWATFSSSYRLKACCSRVLASRGLLAQSGSQVGNDEGDDQHDGKGDEVLGVIDRERPMRWHKKEIEGDHAAKRGEDSGATTQLDRYQCHGQQKQHGGIG